MAPKKNCIEKPASTSVPLCIWNLFLLTRTPQNFLFPVIFAYLPLTSVAFCPLIKLKSIKGGKWYRLNWLNSLVPSRLLDHHLSPTALNAFSALDLFRSMSFFYSEDSIQKLCHQSEGTIKEYIVNSF